MTLFKPAEYEPSMERLRRVERPQGIVDAWVEPPLQEHEAGRLAAPGPRSFYTRGRSVVVMADSVTIPDIRTLEVLVANNLSMRKLERMTPFWMADALSKSWKMSGTFPFLQSTVTFERLTDPVAVEVIRGILDRLFDANPTDYRHDPSSETYWRA